MDLEYLGWILLDFDFGVTVDQCRLFGLLLHLWDIGFRCVSPSEDVLENKRVTLRPVQNQKLTAVILCTAIYSR